MIGMMARGSHGAARGVPRALGSSRGRARVCRRGAGPRDDPSAPGAPRAALREPPAIIPIIPTSPPIIPLALQA